MPDHINVLNHSTAGKIYALADVHGVKTIFDTVRERLRPEDRLIVVGDLVDRGPDNFQLIDSILQNNADPSKAKIHVVLGNHEAMVLHSIKKLEKVFQAVSKGKEELNHMELLAGVNADPELAAHFHAGNGGKWLLDLFIEEIFKTQTITIDSDQDIEYGPESKIKKVRDYFNTLPYIIRVAGNEERPAINFVHADMPFDDGLLKSFILNKAELDADEIFYVLWARPDDFDPSLKKNELSALTVCGHNIILFEKNLSVRADCNTINCDIGTYLSGISCLLNLTDGKAEIIGTVSPEHWDVAAKNLAQINIHLEFQKNMHTLYQAPYKNCKTFSELNKAIAAAYPDLVDRTLLYLFNNDALTKFGIHTTADFNRAKLEVKAEADSSTEEEKTPLKRPFFEGAAQATPIPTDTADTKKPKKR